MQVRKIAATLGTALFLGAVGVTAAAAPAAATPSDHTATAGAAQATDDRDWRQGYRKGFRDGWKMAREECNMYRTYAFKSHDDNDDYAEGYDQGFERGFDKGFEEYCD